MKLHLRSLRSINPASLTLATIIVVVTIYLSGISILDLIELKTYDSRFLSRGPQEPSPAVVLAMIDEKSLDTEGRWPWPRSRIAALVDSLSRDGARVIAFDIGFLEPEERSQLALIDRFRRTLDALEIENPELTNLIDESRKYTESDRALAEAIERSSAEVVLGYFFHMKEADLDAPIEPGEIERRLERIGDSSYPFILYEDPEMDFDPFLKAYAPESNLEMLTEAAEASGFFTLQSDRDGVVRWLPLIVRGGEELFPPLAVAAVWHYLGKPQLMVKVGRYGVEGIQMGKRFIPTDENGRLLVNYLGPPKTFPHVSITDILADEVPRGTFEDRLVLVGATATGTFDMRSTPLSPVYPGAEIHATVIDNILSQSFITRPNWSKVYDLLAIIVLASLIGIALPWMRALTGLLLAAGLFALHIVVARWLFVDYGAWLNVVYPLLALSTNFTSLNLYQYVTEERERRKIKGAFEHYVSPEVIEEMLEQPERLELGGEQKVLTVLFSDLEGFTSYSERHSPQQMIELLAEYYARMTEQVFAFQGTLKEYVGDELMAIFGAPVDQTDHAERACAAALAMQEHRHALSEEWVQVGRPRMVARTGVNSGPMLVGNLGSKYRFSYGVLGDHVNLGSRLEGMNKQYGTKILIGENTAELVGDSFLLREIDMVRVVGKKKPTRIYELLAASGTALPAEQEKALGTYASGLEAYRQQRWGEALGLFKESLALWPGDGPSRIMAERCQVHRKSPPPEDWDGVFEALQK